MVQNQDMGLVRQKLKELIDVLPLSDKDRKELEDFLLTMNDDELKQMPKSIVDNLTWVKFYWRLKKPKGGQ